MAFKPTQEDYLLTAATIRGLSMDGVQKAKSGHPGMPMGMADVAAVLWLKYLNHCPTRPDWANRDRFVLSAGHGSMLLYSLLHLAGYDVPIEELARFRQWESRTPGHPERGDTPGVETTTGPLGQGCGNAVGMALAEEMLAARFNNDDFQPLDHSVYVIAGDGDLMEGISHEAFSLAGHLGLHKLIVFYDSNRITIEGSTDLAYSDDVKKRFQGYNWNVIDIDGHDYIEIEKAIRKAQRQKERPTIVVCHTHIGYGSPAKQDTPSAHGEPLGEEEVRASKRNLGLPEEAAFYVPERVHELFASRLRSLKRRAAQWERDLQSYRKIHSDYGALWERHFEDTMPDDLESVLPVFDPDTPVATRSASGKVIQALAAALPQLVGGSADLAPSTKTLIAGADSIARGAFAGRNLHFGVREHAMAAVMNGMVLHGGLRVFGATFFVFLDYCRPAVRLAALMKLPVIYVFTHDSFYVGEDGPTHQPVEHLASLRCMPNMTVIRPGDPTETAYAWLAALQNQDGPTALALTRQNLPVIDRNACTSAANVAKGAYTLWQSGPGVPDALLMASGSEVDLILQAARRLGQRYNIRAVSFPSWELFEKQPASYKEDVLPADCTCRFAIEAGCVAGWAAYVGNLGHAHGLNRFGASAPYKALTEAFGFTVDNVVAQVERMLTGQSPA